MSKQNQKGVVNFRLSAITTEEFATFKENHIREKEDFDINLSLQIKANREKHLIGIFTRFSFEQENKPVLLLECACHFLIEERFWNSREFEDHINLPKNFATHLLVLTVGTARGIIHAKKPIWLE